MRGQHLFKDQQFDLDFWPCNLKINRELLLSRGIHCTKFGNFQAQESKDICTKTSSLILTFDQCDLNISGENLLLRGLHCIKFGNFKPRGQLSVHGLVYRPTDQLVQNNMPPYFKGGHNSTSDIFFNPFGKGYIPVYIYMYQLHMFLFIVL